MPPFRTILSLAVTALAALSSAAPIAGGTNQAAQLVNAENVANPLLQGVKVSDIVVSVLSRRQNMAQLANVENVAKNLVSGVEVSDIHVNVLNSRTGPVAEPVNVQGLANHVAHDVKEHLAGALKPTVLHPREELKPIATILLKVKADLEATTAKLDASVKANVELNLEDVKDIIDEVRATLVTAIASVKFIVGQSAAFIFTLDGKVWTPAQVGTLLISIVVNVWSIVATVLRVVVSTSHDAAFAIVRDVVDLLSNLLVSIFVKLDVGIFPVTRVQITAALFKAWTSLHLDGIVAILKNGHA